MPPAADPLHIAEALFDDAPRLFAAAADGRIPREGRLADLYPTFGGDYRIVADRPWDHPTVASRPHKKHRDRYTVTPTGVAHADARCLGVCDPALLRRIAAAAESAAPGIHAAQRRLGREVAGLVTSNDRLGDIRVATCEPADDRTGSLLSSEPYCAGRRSCRAAEVASGRYVLGEFHSHPDLGDPSIRFYPPSGEDLYQLHLAAAGSVHNLSLTVAPEGIYLARALPRGNRALRRDLAAFYRHNGTSEADATARCRQPLPQRFPGGPDAVACLAAVLESTQTVYDATNAAPGLSRAERIERFARAARDRLGVALAFRPFGARRRRSVGPSTPRATAV